jgi:hypothetical protein
MGRFSAYNIYGAFCKILKNTENTCKILKNKYIYTKRQENSLEALLQRELLRQLVVSFVISGLLWPLHPKHANPNHCLMYMHNC